VSGVDIWRRVPVARDSAAIVGFAATYYFITFSGPLIMDVSPSRDAATPAACWWRRRRRRRACRARCAPSFSAVRARRGQHVAAVATARKLAVLIWHLLRKGESYLWARPALHARKMRNLELKAGHQPARGQRGAAHAYNLRSCREQERRWVEQAELAYARFVARWNPNGPRARRGAAKEARQ
jgi:hypothetical protein